MDEHKHNLDREVCLGLGLGLGFTPKNDCPRKVDKQMLFLDLSIPCHDHESGSNLEIIGEDGRSKEDDDEDKGNCSNGSGSKKLRLTRDQIALLEDSFKQHTTLNMSQKLTLAKKLNLKTRQVEVWFQNRRARTKVKQTEVDCKFLKKTCERLIEENHRLKEELWELQSSMAENQSSGLLW